MRPKPHIHLTPADQRIVSLWSRGMLAGSAISLALLLMAPQLYAIADGGKHVDSDSSRSKTCAPWDDSARAAIATLVQSERDDALSHVGDAVFRVRRARRNCQMGWTTLACRDYDAVIRSVPELSRKTTNSFSICGT